MVTWRVFPSPVLSVVTLGCSASDTWIVRRSFAGMGSRVMLRPEEATRSATRKARSRSVRARRAL